jgi:hypothetical protein
MRVVQRPDWLRSVHDTLGCLPVGRLVLALLASRAEVNQALRQGNLDRALEDIPDCLSPSRIPSVQIKGISERSFAEVDQDGFAFAVDPLDKAFFDRRDRKQPRWRYHVEIVLHKGKVTLRKRLLPYPAWYSSFIERFCCLLGLRFYFEAASLLRLRGVPGIPIVRAIDRVTRSIYMDYVAGLSLRHVLARSGGVVLNLDVDADPVLGRLSSGELMDREFQLFRQIFGDRYKEPIEELILSVNRKGVAVMDLHAANLLIGETTHSLYLVDFECSWLSSFPGWDRSLRDQDRSLNDRFHVRLVADR